MAASQSSSFAGMQVPPARSHIGGLQMIRKEMSVVDTRFDQETEHRLASLSVPVQAPPVYRSAVGTAAAGAVGGVEAAGLGSFIDSLSHMIPGSGPVGDVLGWFGL